MAGKMNSRYSRASILCLLLHRWSKWVVIEEGQLLRPGTSDVIGSFITQERVCINCEKIERKTDRTF
jgi:hypothetical protein